jgi:hypothetical protein
MALTCDPELLAIDANCFSCIAPGKKLDVLIYLFAQLANVTTDPQTLMTDAKCFSCIPEGKKMDVLLWIACNLSSGGGGTGGPGIVDVGSPEGVITAPPGTSYLDSSTDNFWFKASGSGNTGWVELIGT